MGKYIGIDLGTTYSVAAYIDENGQPKVIPNMYGQNTTPSVVLFDEDGEVIVGLPAKNESNSNPANYVAFAKRQMGSSRSEWHIEGNDYKPEEISAIILKKIKDDCISALDDEILGAVVTVPAYFTDIQRNATKQAAELAGLPLLGIINEPTAAAIAYGLSKNGEKKQTVLIYDLGGGTFDVSLMEIDGNEIKTIATDGNSMLGGYNFDCSIVKWFSDKLKESTGGEIQEGTDEYHNLLIAAESAKIILSSGKKATKLSCIIEGKRHTEELSAEAFNSLIEPILFTTIGYLDNVKEETNIEYEDIDKIILVGGSTKIPYVKKYIYEETGITPTNGGISPDEAVAKGAAVHAVKLASKKIDPQDKASASMHSALPSIHFTDCTSHGIGIVIQKGNQELNSVIMKKNMPLPASCENTYVTVEDNQENLYLRITQGDDEELDYVTIIGETIIQFPPKPKNYPLRVTVSCDTDSIIHVNVFDVGSNVDLGEVEIDRKGSLSDDEFYRVKNKMGKLDIG